MEVKKFRFMHILALSRRFFPLGGKPCSPGGNVLFPLGEHLIPPGGTSRHPKTGVKCNKIGGKMDMYAVPFARLYTLRSKYEITLQTNVLVEFS